MTEPNSAEDKAMARNLFDTTRDQAFTRKLIAANEPTSRESATDTNDSELLRNLFNTNH